MSGKREELIEEAAKAIGAKSWSGFAEGEYFADAYARIAFEVFEQSPNGYQSYGTPHTPTNDERESESEFAPGECDGSGTCGAPIHVHGCYTPHRSDQCDSPDEYGHTDTTNTESEDE